MRRFVPVVILGLLFLAGCGTVSIKSGSGATTATPAASASSTTTQLPEARQGGFLVEDGTSGRMLLIGGFDPSGAMVTSTWSWDGQRWDQLNVVSQGIDAAFYDSVHKQTIALRATGPTAYGTATWSGTWNSVSSAHLPSRMVFGSGFSVFNPTTTRGLYSGVRNETTDTPGLETWTWDGSDWSLQSGSSPVKRLGYALAYDPSRKTDIFFGGALGGGPNPNLADTWSWNGSSWTQLHPIHTPSPGDAYATFDESLNTLVLLDFTGNVWRWSGTDWIAVPSSGQGPGTYHRDAAFGYDPVSRQVIVFGGSSGGAATAHTWLWDGGTAAWTQFR
jgi:hypothetical protein